MNKKATAKEMVLSVMRAFLLMMVIIAVWTIISLFVVSKVETFDIESYVLTNRLLYSPNGIAYNDENSARGYPGVIDLEKFNDASIDNIAYLHDNNIISAKLTLSDLNGNEIKQAYLNKEKYERWEPRAGFEGSGATKKITKKLYALYQEKDTRKSGILKIEVIIPNV